MKRWKFLALLAVLALVVAACGDDEGEVTTTTGAVTTTEGPTTTEGATTTAAPTTTGVAFEGLSYSAPDCGYGGEFKTIEAVDALTVRFELCYPDVAFRSKVAFSAFAIHPTEHLEATGGGGDALISNPIGTGPYKLAQWDRGSQLILTRNDDYWGTPAIAQTLVFRWSTEAAQRLVELQSGQVDGIDNVGTDDFETVAGDASLQLIPRQGLNIFYIGMNNTIPPFDSEQVRQALAMAIDRDRIVDNFYPPGSSVATQFLPAAIPGYDPAATWYEYDPEAAMALLAEAGYADGFDIALSYRDVVRGYLPQPAVVAQDIQAQLAEIGVNVTINVMESGAFLDATDQGDPAVAFHMLGWGADYPDATNFLDYHFGAGSSAQFGNKFEDLTTVLSAAAQLADQAERDVLYAQAAELIKQHVPMIPVAHGGSAVAFKADVAGAHSSPLSNELFAVMDPGGRDTLVWMQNAEPIGLYCADETDGESLRACEQINESLLGFEVGGTATVPALATACDANEELTVWTCTLREGVLFHDGSTFDANDVVMSYVVQWDASHPLHVGRDGSFTYFPGLFGQFLNAPEAEG
jgi:peptide/nickel transport system substrate-binding protein